MDTFVQVFIYELEKDILIYYICSTNKYSQIYGTF